MSRIKKTGQSIKTQLDNTKPLEHTDIIINPNERGEPDFVINKEDLVDYESQQARKPVKLHAGKKKMTFYIPLEIEAKLNEVFTKRVMRNDKLDKSALISRAIHLLWIEDKNYDL